MRMAFYLLIFAMISVSLCHPMVLGPKSVMASPKSVCCSQNHGGSVEGGCKHQPKSNDKECCAGCALCLCVGPGATKIALYPPAPEERDASYQFSHHFRSDRPPVPPPRGLVPA